MSVKSKYVTYRARLSNSNELQNINLILNELVLTQLRIAKIIYNVHKSRNARSHEMSDRRFIKAELNLAHWMLIIVNIVVTNSSHLKIASEHYKQFINYYERLKRQKNLNFKNRVSFKWVRHRLVYHILSLINIVLCTFAIAKKTTLFRFFRSILIVCEKCSRVTEMNIVIILSNYFKVSLILIDDDAQLRSVVKSVEENDFIKQLIMFLFERLRSVKQFLMMFRV